MEKFSELKQKIISHIKHVLESSNSSGHPRKQKIGYSRFQHTMRVYKWMEVLYEAYPHKENVDINSLIIATLFHDIGYYDETNQVDHAYIGSKYCREYLNKINYPTDKIDFICELISMHSDKEKLQGDIPAELILLIEADLLDDTGAQSIVLDIWVNSLNLHPSFEMFLEQIKQVTGNIMKDNPMRTEKGKKLWYEKQQLVEKFISSYERDIDISICL